MIIQVNRKTWQRHILPAKHFSCLKMDSTALSDLFNRKLSVNERTDTETPPTGSPCAGVSHVNMLLFLLAGFDNFLSLSNNESGTHGASCFNHHKTVIVICPLSVSLHIFHSIQMSNFPLFPKASIVLFSTY
jgi:hypothetical protein